MAGPTPPAAARPGGPVRPLRPQAGRSLGLFWRTFFMLALLLLGSLVAWLQIFRWLETEPQSVQNAQLVASLVNLSRASLRYSDAIARLSLVKTLADEEGLNIAPRLSTDRFVPVAQGEAGAVARELVARLGPDTVVAESVNGHRGLWVGFTVESDAYWLQADDSRLQPARKRTWLLWLLAAGLLSLLGAAALARVLNRPLRRLSLATAQLRQGKFDATLLDERASTSEIREVNIGFNRMAAQLAQMEQDRAMMLAGISHDLRTPLARLRLDTEMSVADADARAHMAADIEQLDAILDKFLDYVRPQSLRLERVDLEATLARAAYAFSGDAQLRISWQLPPGLAVRADAVELLRVLSNLLENARRYGQGADGVARVDIEATASQSWVQLQLSDHGPGVPPEQLRLLTQPFFRGDGSRKGSGGAGLGLAIVEASLLRMGGGFSLGPTEGGGLSAHLRLQRA